MHFPVVLKSGHVEIPAHLVFDIFAYSIGFFLFSYTRSVLSDPIPINNRQAIIVAAIGGALLGACVIGGLEQPDLFFNPPSPQYYLAQKSIVGGLVGGLIGVELIKKVIGETRSSGDRFVFPLIVGMTIGRIGCFLTGVSDQTVGNASTLPWAIDQGDGVLRHPTSLYEILFLGALGLLLYRAQQTRVLPNGLLFKFFMVGYLTYRFCVEFIKPTHALLLGLSAIQFVSFCCILYYLCTWRRSAHCLASSC